MTWQGLDFVCQCNTQNSETLYVVFMTIKSIIFTLYVVFDLICLHLSFTVQNEGARTHRGESI
jgi:hypothetical protein